jgi:hypothetical protein
VATLVFEKLIFIQNFIFLIFQFYPLLKIKNKRRRRRNNWVLVWSQKCSIQKFTTPGNVRETARLILALQIVSGE